ncbi:hypothetical protein J4573_50325 [Actinomadura barringtoniae]|uniref:Uncharacterized protein n=1 Tax=Actinomadura barringtoniae TaxID=1427535 RepID=A0A939PMH9_9ACTN|nr:hypothetical protein [Actinomadura barringtoniae]MBO2455355.1 hypothetical protein [Actinomadura barringtoniae]
METRELGSGRRVGALGQLAEALPAAGLFLTCEELEAIERAVPRDAVAGTRYPAPLMNLLDSER